MNRPFRIFVITLAWLCPALHAQDPRPTGAAPGSDNPRSKTSPKRIRIRPYGVRVVHSVKAAYPQTARDKKIQGGVYLDIVIGIDGKVLQVQVLSGDPLLAEAAVEAVHKWVYERTLVNGEPVEVAMFVDIVFLLNH